MVMFTRPLIFTELEGGLYRVDSPVKFYLSDDKVGEYVLLPSGTLTNFASVPKVLQWLCKPDHEDVRMPAAFHDYMVGEFGGGAPFSWSQSAYWFRKMIEVRQRVTRSKGRGYSPIDFIFRWGCYFSVMAHGYLTGRL